MVSMLGSASGQSCLCYGLGCYHGEMLCVLYATTEPLKRIALIHGAAWNPSGSMHHSGLWLVQTSA
jgi:hypothetical protein